VPLNLEGEVSVERARRYKTNAFAAFDDIVEALTATGTMTTAQVHDLLVTANALAANLWQMAHPTPTLAELYIQNPGWGELALDFEPRLTRLLQATAIGLASGEKDPITV
jgi:Tetracyclin repressor-like, C-terminal domain